MSDKEIAKNLEGLLSGMGELVGKRAEKKDVNVYRERIIKTIKDNGHILTPKEVKTYLGKTADILREGGYQSLIKK